MGGGVGEINTTESQSEMVMLASVVICINIYAHNNKENVSLTAFHILRVFVCFFVCFTGPFLWHVEVPRLGVQSELQLPAFTTATAMPDLSCVCDLHHNSRQSRILNSLSEARG